MSVCVRVCVCVCVCVCVLCALTDVSIFAFSRLQRGGKFLQK